MITRKDFETLFSTFLQDPSVLLETKNKIETIKFNILKEYDNGEDPHILIDKVIEMSTKEILFLENTRSQ